MNNRFFLTVLLISLASTLSFSQTDTVQRRNLDSLYLSWIEDRLMVPVTLISQENENGFAVMGDSDSVYEARLRAIPSIVDLTYNENVRRYIDMYVNTRKNQVEIMLGLADYYFPIFEEILAAEGLPLELKYVPVIESGLNPVATSRVGAQGLWQFMYGTAKFYGLEINSFVDERWDPVKSSQAAVRYLKDLFDIYGDWHLVIAAYNCGPGNVNKAIMRAGGKRNYWDIFYHLPRETRGYVPAFVAATYIMNYHHVHNMVPATAVIPSLVDTIWVNHDLHFSQVSSVMEIPVPILQKLNPQYRRDIVPTVGGPYALRLPADKISEFIALEDSITGYKREVYFSQVNLNKAPSYSRYIPDPPKGNYVTLTYQVKSGDNLGFIAEWYDVSLSRLRYWNNIYGSTIRVGQKLTIYVADDQREKYQRIDQMTFAEKQALEGKVYTEADALADNQQEITDEYVYYTVQSGDNLWSIARKYPGVSNTDIMQINGMSDTRLKPGDRLKIRPKTGSISGTE